MTERRPRRRPGENREQLLKAGLIEFGLRGYHGASTADIARRAGVPQPHLYASFRTKHELFEACAERALDQLAEEAAPATDAPPDPEAERFLLQLVAALADPDASTALPALRTRLNGAFNASALQSHVLGAVGRILARGE